MHDTLPLQDKSASLRPKPLKYKSIIRNKAKSLDGYKRGFHGALPKIWSKIPIDIITKGERKGWLKIKSDCVDFLTGKTTIKIHKNHAVSVIQGLYRDSQGLYRDSPLLACLHRLRTC